MSLIFPKKPLYAPMLGTLGGGSAKGFGALTQLGGGQWMLQFDQGTNQMYVENSYDILRYNDTQEAGYFGYDDLGAGGTRSAHIVKVDKEGAIVDQGAFHRNGGFELRSFDVWDDGSFVYMGEDGGNTYVGTAGSNFVTNGTGHTFTPSHYGYSLNAYTRSGVKELAYVGRDASSGSMEMRNYYWDGNTHFAGLASQQESYYGSTIIPRKVVTRTDTYRHAVAGRVPSGNTSGFLCQYGNFFTTQFQGQYADVGQYNDFGDGYGAMWHKGNRNITANTTNTVWTCGYQQNGAQNFGYIWSLDNGGMQQNYSFVSHNTGYGNYSWNLFDMAYDDVQNQDKGYIVGKSRSQIAIRNASSGLGGGNRDDGLIFKAGFVDGQRATLDWVVSVSHSGTDGNEYHVQAKNCVVDDEGFLWVYLMHNGITSFGARQGTILRIDPNKGPLTGTYGGLTFTDMTTYTQFTNASANTGGIDHRSGSWSESNHTHVKKSRNISGTLIPV